MTGFRPKRILLMTPNFQGADGASSMSRAILGGLAEYAEVGARLDVWSLNEDGLDENTRAAPDVDYRFAAGSKLRFIRWAATASLASQRNTLVVVGHPGIAPAAIPFALRGARVVTWLLGIDAWRPFTGVDAIALRKSWKLAAISQYTLDRFREVNPQLAGLQGEVCHLCLTLPNSPAPVSNPSKPFALIVARMASDERYKGHDQLLEVWPLVRQAAPEVELWVAGGGDDRDRLQAKAAELGLRDAVRFLGRVPDQRLVDLYHECLFFVMPSRHEGFGLVFLEAMRAGKACLGSRGASAEIIVDGETGFAVDPDDKEQLTDRLVRLARDARFRSNMGAAGRKREAEVFSERQFRFRLREVLGLS